MVSCPFDVVSGEEKEAVEGADSGSLSAALKIKTLSKCVTHETCIKHAAAHLSQARPSSNICISCLCCCLLWKEAEEGKEEGRRGSWEE